MTDNLLENLLPKLEEKMMVMLTEFEDARKDIQRLSHENALLKADRENNARKLIDLLSLLETVNQTDHVAATATNMTSPFKTVLVQDAVVQEKIGSA